MTAVELMSADEERRLAADLGRLRADPARRAEYAARRHEFVLRWEPLVKWVVGRWFGAEIAAGRKRDRVQDGSVELIRALDDYDPSRAVRFSTFAVMRVRGGIRRALLDVPQVRPSHWSGEAAGAARAADRAAAYRCEGGDALAPVRDYRWDRDARRAACAEAVEDALGRLRGRDRDRDLAVLTLRFGLDGGGRRSFASVGESIGYSSSRAQQIEAEALGRLRNYMRETA